MLDGTPFGTIEALPEMFLLFCRDTWPFITHRDESLGVYDRQLYGYWCIMWRVAEGIDQIGVEDPRDAFGVSEDRNTLLRRRNFQDNPALRYGSLLLGHSVL